MIAPKRLNSRQIENVQDECSYHNLIGPKVVPGTIFNDPLTGLPTMFFVFPNLSVRVQGKYRIRCQVTDVGRKSKLTRFGNNTRVVFTDVFTMYPPNSFPGVVEPTDLDRSFVAQGMKQTRKTKK